MVQKCNQDGRVGNTQSAQMQRLLRVGPENAFMIENKVKLVVWDLDETFWRGTLTEGGMAHIESNIETVRELSKRGIISSICSKNDYEQAKAKLCECGIWDYFVFPSISFNPKGKAIAEMIEGAALRPQNVLFLDDNPSNLEEAKFFNPGIMTANPVDVLENLLDHPSLAGKPDPELTRLKQYQFLQRKVEERGATALSNEEFLRASNIRIVINNDIEPDFDRVVELINRTNQLNYTKIRLETDDEVQGLRDLISGRNVHAGTVHVVDNYGDYGLVGFYLGMRRSKYNKLIHFVFSCRTMNMGVEQYVYETLSSPDIEIVGPVSYGLKTHDRVDWINVGGGDRTPNQSGPVNEKLVLLGGCDLLQLASYCSTDRSEFVNEQREGAKIRFDDPGFILSDRSALKRHAAMGRFAWWTHDDAVRFDEAVASAKLILLSLWPGMNGYYFHIGQDISVRFTKGVANEIRQNDPDFFGENFAALDLEDDGRLALIEKSLDVIASNCGDGTRIFSLGCYTRGLDRSRAERRILYNKTCREYCERHPERFQYVDVDSIVPPEMMANRTHFLRPGYFALAQYILAVIRGHKPVLPVLHDEGGRSAEEGKTRGNARRAARTQRRQERSERKSEERPGGDEPRGERAQRREERKKKRAARHSESTTAEG